MLDPIKAQSTPQFNWYTCWTSLGANGMPDKLIKEGLKQTNKIKISFEKGSKDITGHIAPDQTRFGPVYFLTFAFPDFKLKILTQLSEAKKKDGPKLFSLMAQGFQDIGLTEWTNVVGKQCPNNMLLTKENFGKCIRDYLKEVAGIPNIGNQLICWLCIAKKPVVMPTHEFMWHQVQLFSYLDSGYLHQMMELSTAQEKVN
jgi:hypothetical protein